jgi:CubicO group peptidase (beta-lactamase class C family)
MRVSRRQFLNVSAASVGSFFIFNNAGADALQIEWERMLDDAVKLPGIPGISACRVDRSGNRWSYAAGWADLAGKRPMTVASIQNIASVSKTVTATAVMQCFERKVIELDVDVSAYLPFPLRNHAFPDSPITVRHLLTHQSSLKDGPAYAAGYSCGDPETELGSWLTSILDPSNADYEPRQYFIPREPGTRHAYSNIGYGILAWIVERTSGQPFAEYTAEHILAPLHMSHSGWYIRDVDRSAHAIPHVFTAEGRAFRNGLANGDVNYGYQPLCLYSFPNYPDGLLRTSAAEFSLFIRAYLNADSVLLQPDTYRAMLRAEVEHGHTRAQGLCWIAERRPDAKILWGHDGGDPGVTTKMLIDPEAGIGAAVFTNGSGHEVLNEIMSRLMAAPE